MSRNGTKSEVVWTVDDASTETAIYRDGVLLVNHKGSGKISDSLDDLQKVSYVLDASHKVSKSDLESISYPSTRARIESAPQLYSRVNIVGVTVGPNGNQNSASASANATSTLFRYQAFIKDATIGVGWAAQLGCSNGSVPMGSSDYFLGDNRSYAPTPPPNTYSPAYRTRFDVLVDWIQRRVVPSTYVGVTNLVHVSNDSLAGIYSKNPDKSSMVLSNYSSDGVSASFTMDQDVRDPFCSSNGIYVTANVSLYRTGSYSISGFRIQVPNQEIYVKDADVSAWTPILKAAPLNMDCLNPLFTLILGCVTGVTLSGSR